MRNNIRKWLKKKYIFKNNEKKCIKNIKIMFYNKLMKRKTSNAKMNEDKKIIQFSKLKI